MQSKLHNTLAQRLIQMYSLTENRIICALFNNLYMYDTLGVLTSTILYITQTLDHCVFTLCLNFFIFWFLLKI